jgi:competence protein ComGC
MNIVVNCPGKSPADTVQTNTVVDKLWTQVIAGLVLSLVLLMVIVPLLRYPYNPTKEVDTLGPLQIAWILHHQQENFDEFAEVYPPSISNLRAAGAIEIDFRPHRSTASSIMKDNSSISSCEKLP